MFEAIIGLRLMSDGWGGIDGVDVRYHVGDEHAVLTLDEQYLICAVADGCLAEAPTESP
jgi:hypothetical protein